MSTLAIADKLDGSFYSGASVTSTTPNPFPVAINGRGYMLDLSFQFGRKLTMKKSSIPMLRAQADTGDTPGEQSLNPDGLWRRTVNSWHMGAGQTFFDKPDSTSARFRTSKGIDPWTKYQITLLDDTAQRVSSANTNLYLAVAGSRLYYTDSATLKFVTATTFASPTTVTGTPAGVITSIASDGFNVWIACTANGLYTTTRSSTAATQQVTTALTSNSVVGYVKGRLMVSKDNAIYNVTAAGPAALPTALFMQANTDFVWVGFAEGPGNVYAAGFSGDKSLIYRTGILTDGTALAAPVVAGELPDGEIIRSIQGYLGNMVIGSDKGVRFCEFDSSGNLLVGDLISTTSAVQCFEPQDRFVWYGLTNYDGTSTGLGRLDLRTFNGDAPAYASDLMATGQGAVLSVVTFGGVRVFSVSGLGFYAELTTKVASGTIDSGYITFGIIDQKVAVFVHAQTLPLVGSVTTSLALDDGTFSQAGVASSALTIDNDYPTVQTLSNQFEVREVLARASGADTVGPTLVRHTLRANPAAPTGYEILVPVRFHEELMVGGLEVPLVPSTEFAILDDLRLSRRVVSYQEGDATYQVTVESLEFIPESMGRLNHELNGLCQITLHTLA